MSQYISDLEDLIKQWGNRYAERNNTTALWVDLHAKHPDMAQYQKYKLGVRVRNVRYEEGSVSNEMPPFKLEDTSTNNTPQPIENTFEQSRETTTVFTWNLNIGINTGSSSSFTSFLVGIPPIASWFSNMSTEMEIDATSSKTETEVQSWSIKRRVIVPHHSRVDMTWSIGQETSFGTFHADVVLTGYVAVWLEDRVDINDPDEGSDDHWLWFVKIAKVFRQMKEWGIPVPYQYRDLSSSVIYKVSGSCDGQCGYDSEFDIKETPLNPSKTAHERCVTEIGFHAF